MSTQILKLTHNHSQDNQHPLFCPFTGKIIISCNPHDDLLETDYPNTVLATWTPEFTGWDQPNFLSINFTFELNHFQEIEDINQLSQLIDSFSNDENYMLIDYSTYGSIPGDFGRIVFLLKIPS